MARILRLLIVIGIALLAGGGAIYLAPLLIVSLKEDTAKATIVAGVITLLGVIFSAMYGEISSYYKDRSANAGKKWELIYPLVKQHYYPWINSGESLANAIEEAIKQIPASQEAATRLLYLTSVFYGYRLQFIIQAGGLVLLSSNKEEKKVNDSYRNFKRNFQWAGDETPRRVSYLQSLYVKKNKPDNPYVLAVFSTELTSDPLLKDSLAKLSAWTSGESNLANAHQTLQEFTARFKKGIDRLYSAW